MWAGFAAGTVVFVVRLFLRRIRLRERKKTHFPFHLLVFCSFSTRFIHEKSSRLQPLCPTSAASFERIRETRNNKLRRQPGRKNTKISFPVPWMNCKQMSNDEWKWEKTTRETRTNENKFTTCRRGREIEEQLGNSMNGMFCEWKRRRRGMKSVRTEYRMSQQTPRLNVKRCKRRKCVAPDGRTPTLAVLHRNSGGPDGDVNNLLLRNYTSELSIG